MLYSNLGVAMPYSNLGVAMPCSNASAHIFKIWLLFGAISVSWIKSSITFHKVTSCHGLGPFDDVRVVSLGPSVSRQQVGGATVACYGDGAWLEHGVNGILLEPNCQQKNHFLPSFEEHSLKNKSSAPPPPPPPPPPPLSVPSPSSSSLKRGYVRKWLSNWILTSCRRHKAISGRSDSLRNKNKF